MITITHRLVVQYTHSKVTACRVKLNRETGKHVRIQLHHITFLCIKQNYSTAHKILTNKMLAQTYVLN